MYGILCFENSKRKRKGFVCWKLQGTLLNMSNQKNLKIKRVYVRDCLPTDVAVLIKKNNTFILNPTAIKKNDELRKFIIEKMILNTPPITGRDYTANSVAQSSCDRVRKNN
jgi:hypothetical protein